MLTAWGPNNVDPNIHPAVCVGQGYVYILVYLFTYIYLGTIQG